LAPHPEDDGFHEIQLNGKQLVFLFMAATVASVVIFLCGVLVGRGVRAERGVTVADPLATSTGAAPDTAPAPQQAATAAPPTPAGSDPTAAAPPPAVDDLSYSSRLEKQKQPKEVLKPAPGQAARQDKSPSAEPNAAPPAARTSPPPVPNEPSAKPGPGAADLSGDYAVQVAALNARGEADAIARRLASKGYASYVVPPGNGAVMYRVRVGHFKTRRDAEPVFEKLKEEQFKPWITR
jgi:cell division septation protein DedD